MDYYDRFKVIHRFKIILAVRVISYEIEFKGKDT